MYEARYRSGCSEFRDEILAYFRNPPGDRLLSPLAREHYDECVECVTAVVGETLNSAVEALDAHPDYPENEELRRFLAEWKMQVSHESSPDTSGRLLNQELRDGVTVIEFGPGCKKLEEGVLDEVRDILLETVDRIDPPKLLLDLSQTQFFGSAFIELVVRVWKRIRERKGQFAVCWRLQQYSKEPPVASLRLFAIYADQDAAIKGMNDGG